MSDQHTILVVDDNEAGRYVKACRLRQAGYQTIEAAEGYQALLALRRDLPALVVLDIILPGIDGLEICRRIKRDPDTAHIMVLQTSGLRVSTEDRLAGLEIGADAYLVEPFEPQEFLATVKTLLRLYDREMENRQMVTELRESEARWRTWFDSSTAGMYQADILSGSLQRVNPYLCELLGHTEEELIGRAVFDITHPDDRAESLRGFMRLARGEIAELRLEERHLKKDGGLVWTEVTINAVRDGAARPLRTVAMVQDISGRKRHELGRAILLEVTRRIIEDASGDAPLIEAVFDSVRTYLNVDICFNYRIDGNVLRLVSSKGIPPEWLAAAQELALGEAFCGTVAAQLQPLIADAELIANDERGAFVRAMGVRAYAGHPLLARGGAVLGTISFASTRRERFAADEIHLMEEVSHVLALAWERRRAEEAQRRERDTLNLALLSGQMGVYDWDMVHDRLWWSPENFAVFGAAPEIFAPCREGFSALVHPEDRERLWRLVNQAIENHQPSTHEFRIVRPDGALRWIANRAQTQYDAAGKPVRHFGIAIDITERKRIELNAEFMLRFGRDLGRLTDADALANAALRAAAEHLGVTACALLKIDAVRQSALVAYQWSRDEKLLAADYPFAEFVCADTAAALQAGDPVVVADVGADPRTREFAEKYAALGIAAWIAVPHFEEDAWEAVIAVGVAAPRPWRTDEVRCLQNVIARVWPAVKSARAVADLHASETQLRLIADNLPIYIVHCDAEERYRFVNQPYAERFGLRPEDLIGKRIDEVLGASAHASLRDYISAVLGGRTVEFEQAIPYERGTRQMRCAYIPEPGADGKTCGFFALIQDVTAQKLAEEQTAQLAALVTSSVDAIISFSPDGKVLTWNRAAERLLGWSVAAAVGMPKTNFVPETKLNESADIFARALRGEAVRQFETVRRRQDGSLVEVSVTLSPVRVGGDVVAISEIMRDITQRKQWESDLRYQTDLLQAVTDNIRSCLLIMDSEGRATFANAATEQVTGFKPQELIGFVLHERIHHSHPDGTPFLRNDCPIDRALPEFSVVENFEDMFVHKDGYFYPVRCSARPIIKDGAPVGTVIEVRDISEEKKNQAALRASEERLRQALESADAGMWDLDLQSNAMVWSPENCRLYGIEPDKFIPSYETWRARVHPDDLERIEREREDNISSARPYRVEYRVRKPSGEVRWLASHGRAYQDANGQPLRMLGINIDITERKQIEEDRLKFQALVESSSDYIGMAEPGGNCFYLNPAGRALVGVDSPEAMFSHRPEDFIADEDKAIFHQEVVPALRERGKWEGEIRLKHQKTGAPIDALRSLFVVKEPHSGAPLCIGTVSRDMREQKRLERLLTQRVEELREADRAKDHFLALLSHELRNPLAPITNAAALLRRWLPADDANLRWCVEVIEGQLNNMSRMLEDLLDVSRITRGNLELRRQPTELLAVLQQGIETSQPLIDSYEHKLIAEIPDQPIWVDVDATRLSQVIANLLNNAAKYTDPGGRIELGVKLNDERAEIHVADNGQGISAELLPKIFDLFAQGDTHERSGLGIGLTVCKSLVEMHGGSLEVRSAGPKQGSEFIVYLPAIAAPASNLAAAPDNGAAALTPVRAVRMLVVDDNREQAATLGALLTSHGHDVRIAADGMTAMKIAREFVPEVALIDIGMPEMDGCELARRLRALPQLREMTLVAQTGWGRADDRQRTQAAGFNHHLVKPLNPSVLEGLLWQIGTGDRPQRLGARDYQRP